MEDHMFSFSIKICRVFYIDYLIWMTPYKRYQYNSDELPLPMATVYDLKHIDHELIEYDEKRMVSSEK